MTKQIPTRFRRKVKQILAAFLCVTMIAPAIPAAAAPKISNRALAFGKREQDWDYNRVKAIGKDRVFSLYHNEYLEYKRFNSIKLNTGEPENFGIYFEFSYPYNCYAQMELYEITDSKIVNAVKSGEKILLEEDMLGFLETLASPQQNQVGTAAGTGYKYLGILEGRTLQSHVSGEGGIIHTNGQTLAEIEKSLAGLKVSTLPDDKKCMNYIDVYGTKGIGALYNTLEEYCLYRGIDLTELYGTQETETETETETENETETETASETESETETESELESETESETKSETESESGTKTESAAGTESESHSETETSAETENAAEEKNESEADSETKSESESGTKSESAAESKLETGIKAESTTQTAGGAKSVKGTETNSGTTKGTAAGAAAQKKSDKAQPEPSGMTPYALALKKTEPSGSEASITSVEDNKAEMTKDLSESEKKGREETTQSLGEQETEQTTDQNRQTGSVTERESETGKKPESGEEPETKTESETKTEPESESEGKTEPETETATAAETELESETESESETELETETELDSEAEIEKNSLTIPEDFYILDKDSYAPMPALLQEEYNTEMWTSIVHNYMIWNGYVYPDGAKAQGQQGQQSQPGAGPDYSDRKYIADQDGVYVIVLQPVPQEGALSGTTSLEKQRVYLPFQISRNGSSTGEEGGSGSEEDMKDFFSEMYMDRAVYLTYVNVTGGDPVDLISGSLEWSYTDLQSEGTFPLSFTRSYRSEKAEQEGVLGQGWSHNFNYTLDSFYGTVSITIPTGSRMDFVQEYDGTYATAPGSAYSLENISGGYLLSHAAGDRIYFGQEGLPVKIIDLNENVITLENDGEHITDISSVSGSLHLSYSGDTITSVTDQTGRRVDYSYGNGNLTEVTNPDGDTMRCSYDGSHNLTKVTGFSGEEMMRNEYNSEHQVTEQTLPDLGTYTFSYDKENRTNTHTAENGLKQTIVYDSKYRIISDTNNDGTVFYTFDDANRRTSETDRKGNKTVYEYAGDTSNVSRISYPDGTSEEYSYNSKNQVTSKVQRDGTVLGFSYDGNGNLTRFTDASGGVTEYTYDSDNNCTKKTDSLGGCWSYTYDSAGHRLTQTDPLQAVTSYEYDDVGRITKQSTPEGLVTQYSYSAGGKLMTMTDAAGNNETFDYSGNGFLTGYTDKRGSSESFTYSAMNHMLTETDREGNTTVYTYENNDQPASVTDAEGNTVSYEYDALGRRKARTDGNGNTVRYSYDANGNRTETTSAEGGREQASYDENNRLTKYVDANGNETAYSYDAMGRLTHVTDAQGGVIRYHYDPNGRLTGLTDANGNRTSYEYDTEGSLTAITDALGHRTEYTYDAAGRCIQTAQADGSSLSASYDSDGRRTEDTDEAGGSTAYTYDANNRLTSMTAADGSTTSYTYDENGNVLTITNAAGETISYTYDRNDRLLSETDAMEGTTAYTYRRDGLLSGLTDAMGGRTAYTYDKAGNIVQVEDPMGYLLRYTYDRDNRIQTVTDANGNTTAYEYDKAGNLTVILHADGGRESYTYDGCSRVTAYTDAEGGVTTYTYDAAGNLTAVTDPEGHTSQTAYDALNRRIETTDAMGGTIRLTYDSMGRITQAVNADGAVTAYTYDTKGQLTAITDALGHSHSYTYDSVGNVLTETDENGAVTAYTYDRLGNCTSMTDALGNTEQYEYDKNSNLIRVSDKRGNTFTYAYDALNRVTAESDGYGRSQSFTYDKNGHITAVTDRNGNTTTYTLDANGNIIALTDALGHHSYFAYDAMNRMTQIKLYSGEGPVIAGERVQTGEQITLYTYDKRGLVKTEVNAAGLETAYTYDKNGNLTQKQDADGYRTVYGYDAVNRVSDTVWYRQDGSTEKQAQYLYNNTGELVQMQDWNGTTSIERDLLNRITQVKDHKDRITGYQWDNTGRLSALTYPEGAGTALFTYDAAGNQLSAEDTDGQKFTFEYDENGNMITKQYANKEMERYQYDANNRRIRLDEYTLTGEQKTYTVYTYDANGNRTSDQNRVPTSMVRNWQKTNNTGTWGGDWNVYTYDALNRLVREKEMDTGLTIHYGYDSLGNKTLEQDSRDNLRYTYNELNQLITKEAYNRTTNYSYDNRGNRILETSVNTQENRRTYEWDETNRLVKGTRGPDYGLYTSEYTYNALGQRVNSTIMGPDKTKYDRDYTIDYTSPDYHDIAEYNTGHYQWQGTKKVHDLTYLYTADGQRLQVDATRYNQWSPEAVTYKLNVHEDIMGSGSWYTRQESGYNANHHDYTTWGNNTKAPTYNYDPEYRATEPYYTGHPYDGSLNIYYAKNRFYDAETGSWLSPDPAKDGLNWYQYCGSNPVTYVDPLGLKKIKTNNFFFKKLSGSEELWSELGLPSDVTGEFHRYEDFSKFGSIYDQHTLQQLAYTDNLGFRRIIIEGLEEPAYMAALGSYYTDYNSKGVVFRVELENGFRYNLVAGDMKDDIHTNSTNQYTNVMPNEPHDIIEFIMDTTNSYAKQLLKKSEGGKGWGTLNYGPEYQFMCSPIVSIEKFEVPILQ